jgi:hypothetical protein
MIPYLNFNYIYPPRPEFKVPPDELYKFEGQEYLAQPKYNGSCCLVFTNGEKCYVYNRHKNPMSNVSPNIDFNQLAKSNHWYVYAGEYLNKGKLGEDGTKLNDKFVIWDVLVWQDQYLVGETLADRLILLEEEYPSNRIRVSPDGVESYEHLCFTNVENVFKAPTYTAGFTKLYNEIVEVDLYEGLVLKKAHSKLNFGFNELNNNDWQVKCRKPTKIYKF